MKKYIHAAAVITAFGILASCSSTPLFKAAGIGNVSKMQKLLNDGRSVNERGKQGRTPLINACVYDKPQAALFLIEKGADVSVAADRRWTAMHMVARYMNEPGSLKVAQALKDHGADINVRSTELVTPLMMAAYCNDAQLVEWLIAQGAQMNALDNDGVNALDYAYANEARNTARVLESKGMKAKKLDSPWAAAAPANIDNMVYKERGTVIFTTGLQSGGAYYSSSGGQGSHFGGPLSPFGLSYVKTGPTTARLGCWSGHSGSAKDLRFTSKTSGYVYHSESFCRDDESVSNERIPFTLEPR